MVPARWRVGQEASLDEAGLFREPRVRGYLAGHRVERRSGVAVEVKFGMEDLPKAQRVSYTNQKS